MDAVTTGYLTERHLTLFGTIVQWFARHELLMQEIMATVSGADSGSIILLTRDFRFPTSIVRYLNCSIIAPFLSTN